MSDLKRQLRSTAKQGNQFPALVVDTFYGKATIRLSHNGAILRNLDVIGGPVTLGDSVTVDFTTDTPRVVALGQEQLEISDITALLETLGTLGQTNLFAWQILHFSSGVLANFYSPDSAGLTAALVDATDGVVYLPAIEVSGDFTIANGVTLVGMDMERSKVLGQVTAYGGLFNLTVTQSGNSADPVIAVLAQPSVYVQAYRNCYISATNAGSGDAYAVWLGGARSQSWLDCVLDGVAEGAGNGYGLYVSSQMMADSYIRGGKCGGSTAPYFVEA